jgi:solute carrier family 25 citrate transporter 1
MLINILYSQQLLVDLFKLGGITGAIEISITFPTEYLKTVMQLYPEMNKKGTMGVIKETLATKGPLGIFFII